ncbi:MULTISPECIES: hypothetical protein [unclassified Erwinia]|uniref:hypothetical protein n=1 Tax=unclassified Erwinia TaxID=2622719 RepID=UPI000C19636B|nr:MULTISPECIES: hypothetical protein [unclassified Erwinia]PIJ48380.1 hypothetical protein BV501_17325 [Erwinia sp. OAMSP11]PIJ79883.1 hypothetical protein BLD47_12465 [Erwinia sp. OLCASP19]PIJ81051.1 hypothetical protein BLD46_13275 [Erwinia sp. OLMTSP26]PIJ93107.1 hypothetical protein BL249_05120 [Erwinia sp. OLFS4]
MKFKVGLPSDFGFRYVNSVPGIGAETSIFMGEKIHQIGSNVDIEVRDGVFIRIEYIEDYDDNTSFSKYEKRASDYAYSIIDELKKAQ